MNKRARSANICRVCLTVLMPLLIAAGTESEQKTRDRFNYLCSYSKEEWLPRPFESDRCDNKEAVRAADVSSLQAEMEGYWSGYAAPTARQYFEDAFARHYAQKHPPPPPTAEAFKKMDTDTVCKWWRNRKPPAALAELKRKAAFSTKDIDLISAKTVAPGMTESALMCSWGPADGRSRTVTQTTTHIQYRYGDRLVYVDNGVVTAWQD